MLLLKTEVNFRTAAQIPKEEARGLSSSHSQFQISSTNFNNYKQIQIFLAKVCWKSIHRKEGNHHLIGTIFQSTTKMEMKEKPQTDQKN